MGIISQYLLYQYYMEWKLENAKRFINLIKIRNLFYVNKK